MRATADADDGLPALAEDLRAAVGDFVRRTREAADTPSAAWSDALGELDRSGPMSVAALARSRRVRHQSMRVTIARLEAEGLVARAPDPDDARGHVVTATAAGRATLQAARAARTGWIVARLRQHATPGDGEAMRAATRLLRRLAAAD